MVSNAIDCRRPLMVDVTSGQNPECLFLHAFIILVIHKFIACCVVFPWKYSFTQLVCDVLQQITHSASYEDILRHEKKLRAHYKPDSLAWPPPGVPFPDEAVGRTFQRYIAAVWENAGQ
jgi:hypothetical protein